MKWTCTSISGHTKYEGEEIILLTLEAATSLPFRVKIVNIFGEEKIHSKLTDMSYRVINGIKYVDFGFPPSNTSNKNVERDIRNVPYFDIY